MKKILFITFLIAVTTVNAQSYGQSRNWDNDTLRTLQQVTDYGVELKQTGDSVYSFDIKDPAESSEFFEWISEYCFFGKEFDNIDLSQTQFSTGYGFKFPDQWVITCLITQIDNEEFIMKGQVKRTGAKSWGYE